MSDEIPEFDSYTAMFSEYLTQEKSRIQAKDYPMIHHVRALCRRLDSNGLDQAALASAYLQAVERLNKRLHPPATGGGKSSGADGDLPGQTSIFDELD